MGLLTAAQKTAIKAGRPIYHTWSIWVPENTARLVYTENVIDQRVTWPHTNRVIDPGSRKYRAVGVNLMDKRKLMSVKYSIEVDNNDGVFYPRTSGETFWKNLSTGFYAAPQWCYLKHKMEILQFAGGLAEITAATYVGWILEVEYADTATLADGLPAGATAVITTEDAAAYDVLRREWTKDDADTTDTAVNFSF